ncbi:MAG: 2-succinyl-5-enolpyruvyl-6-hydroxy-3-cyclohexene-1-carboxylate synthase [Bacteroidales bacterium]|nr:2-succinyl-5-enolpyruvyl-6-hydroxy-3-cyclohexene-1-carboxylate synthase [Bacteroidales bacterium]
MNTHYTVENHVQILIAVLKAKGIRKVIASPGTTNIAFVASIQSDSFFEIYSAADERSAAYIACGLAAESGEPVVLTCTGATASRNYYPALTEAYYRALPIFAVTSSQVLSHTGQYFPQMLDRSTIANDVVKYHVSIEPADTDEQRWDVENKVNTAILELFRNGGGPVNINLVTRYSKDFSVKELPKVRVISRYLPKDKYPEMPIGKIGIYVGSHSKWNEELTAAVDKFCQVHNAVVFGDHTSNYKGKYKILDSIFGQDNFHSTVSDWDLMIYIGYISGEYSTVRAKKVWRVNPDGELRDVFKTTEKIFQTEEVDFFNRYNQGNPNNDALLKECKDLYNKMLAKIPELPFSNLWCAKQISQKLPSNSVLHLGILNSLRSWNFFDVPDSVSVYSNVGGFGIDGFVSSLIGASLFNKEQLYFGIVGDLAFFYDMNSLGNRHVGNNIRIMLINNGRGTEFRNYNHPAQRFNNDADPYMAAAGHYGNKSPNLIKHYAEDLGFEYLTASNKEDFLKVIDRFLEPEITEKPILLEVFTDSKDESDALFAVRNVEKDAKSGAKQFVKEMLGEKGVGFVKKIVGK